MTTSEHAIVQTFVDRVRLHYGRRLVAVSAFGSRARGDSRVDSDVDLVIVLEDDGWDFIREKLVLSDLAFDVLIKDALNIEAWPVTHSDWVEPISRRTPFFVIGARGDAISIDQLA